MKRLPESTVRMLTRIACLAFSLGALAWIFRRVDLQSVGRVLASADAGWMAAAGAAFGLALFAAAARWHVVLRIGGCQVHPGATVRTVLVGHLFNTILFGPTGGDVAKTAYYGRQFGFSTGPILASCVLDRFLGGMGFILFAVCMPGFAAYGGRWWDRVRVPGAYSLGVVLGAAVLLALAGFFLRRRIDWWPALRGFSRSFLSHANALLRRPALATRGVLFSALSHLCVSCVFLFCLNAVTEARFSFLSIFWIFPVISMITSAPVTFAGAGLREGAALFFLSKYGIPEADAVAASILVLTTYLVWAVIGGVLFWRGESRTGLETRPEPGRLSVIIPALNEAEALPETIARARQVPEVAEIIVVDGGSTDATREVAEQLGCRVLDAPRGRGGQMAAGAREAKGGVIVLLHADTWLPPEAGKALLNCLRDQEVVGGGFWKVFKEKSVLMSGSRFRCALRLFLFGRVMGDQVMFVRRDSLAAIGGVPEVPMMEDFELCRRLRKAGRLALASATVVTSARRFNRLGVFRAYLRIWHVTARYYLGTEPAELQEIYERE